ncbi:hypothetical protein LYZ84_22515, partial [Xanthomonas hortorum pv. pelargonii]|nr:hypothetical protein [Xanthomonas hortorum pv. pelargonii]
MNSSVYRLLLIDTSESTIFHGLEMSRKPWAYHSIKSHSDAEDDVQFAVSQARAGGRFRPGPLPEQKELIAPAAR